ncbi:MAG TPA: hypothetical protein VD863_06950 [Bradyrhizobium sp.]|nr:hypothetical protein [Bradyrhizobium sp.]
MERSNLAANLKARLAPELTWVEPRDDDAARRAEAALIELVEAMAVRDARADYAAERARNSEAGRDLR